MRSLVHFHLALLCFLCSSVVAFSAPGHWKTIKTMKRDAWTLGKGWIGICWLVFRGQKQPDNASHTFCYKCQTRYTRDSFLIRIMNRLVLRDIDLPAEWLNFPSVLSGNPFLKCYGRWNSKGESTNHQPTSNNHSHGIPAWITLILWHCKIENSYLRVAQNNGRLERMIGRLRRTKCLSSFVVAEVLSSTIHSHSSLLVVL